MEAPGGFEPPHRSFADCSLSHLGTAPRWALYRAGPLNTTRRRAVTLTLPSPLKGEGDSLINVASDGGLCAGQVSDGAMLAHATSPEERGKTRPAHQLISHCTKPGNGSPVRKPGTRLAGESLFLASRTPPRLCREGKLELTKAPRARARGRGNSRRLPPRRDS